jgi:hypothetical protein
MRTATPPKTTPHGLTAHQRRFLIRRLDEFLGKVESGRIRPAPAVIGELAVLRTTLREDEAAQKAAPRVAASKRRFTGL